MGLLVFFFAGLRFHFNLAAAFWLTAAGRLPYTPATVSAPGVFLVLWGAPSMLLKVPLILEIVGAPSCVLTCGFLRFNLGIWETTGVI